MMDQEMPDLRNVGEHRNFTKLRLVAIHFGASNSNKISERQLELAKCICQLVMRESDGSNQETSGSNEKTGTSCDNARPPMDAVEAAVRLVELMENEKSLNCGYGSNLNMHGKVECDASLMSGHDGAWASVGAVTSCKNPIRLAHSLMKNAKVLRPLGLVQPNFLVASGARQWMQEHCSNLFTPESRLISGDALEQYQEYKSNFDRSMSSGLRTHSPSSGLNANLSHVDNKLDTVGSIVIDCYNRIACATSSGGVALKHKGRIGQACVPGAGCWADETTATTTTGVGEYLTATLFARAFHEKLKLHKVLYDLGQAAGGSGRSDEEKSMDFMISKAMSGCFEELLSSSALKHVPARERLVGLLSIVSSVNNNHSSGRGSSNQQRHQNESASYGDNEQDFYLSYGHTTNSLCIAYMMGNSQEGANSFVSRLQDNQEENSRVANKELSSLPGVLIRTLKLNP